MSRARLVDAICARAANADPFEHHGLCVPIVEAPKHLLDLVACRLAEVHTPTPGWAAAWANDDNGRTYALASALRVLDTEFGPILMKRVNVREIAARYEPGRNRNHEGPWLARFKVCRGTQ
jgi:hypothetical protein